MIGRAVKILVPLKLQAHVPPAQVRCSGDMGGVGTGCFGERELSQHPFLKAVLPSKVQHLTMGISSREGNWGRLMQ